MDILTGMRKRGCDLWRRGTAGDPSCYTLRLWGFSLAVCPRCFISDQRVAARNAPSSRPLSSFYSGDLRTRLEALEAGKKH